MRVGFVTQWYPPENVWVPSAIVEGLRAEGHEVVVVTGTPHYPAGKVADGFRASEWRTDEMDDVVVHRVPEYPYRGSGLAGRLAGYASFALSGSVRALTALRDCDVVLVYASPATAALPAMLLRALARVPYVLQVQDIWPDSVVDSEFVRPSVKLRVITRALNAFVSASYAGAHRLVAITSSAVELLGSRPGAHNKVELVYNWAPDPAEQPPVPGPGLRNRVGAGQDATVFLYAGAMGVPQNLVTVVDAFIESGVEAELVLMGSGTEYDKLAERTRDSPRVHLLPPVPLPEATHLTRQADVALVSLSETPLHRATFPSKIQFLCGLGRPLLVIAPGDTAAYVRSHGAGISASPADRTDIAAAFRSLAELNDDQRTSLGHAARAAYEQDFSPAVGASRLADALERAARRSDRDHRRSL